MTTAASFEIEYLQYLGPDGTLVRNDLPEAGRDIARLRELFKQMLFVRTFDTKAIALQRTGKLGTYASCLGHEATHVGIGASMRSGAGFTAGVVGAAGQGPGVGVPGAPRQPG